MVKGEKFCFRNLDLLSLPPSSRIPFLIPNFPFRNHSFHHRVPFTHAQLFQFKQENQHQAANQSQQIISLILPRLWLFASDWLLSYSTLCSTDARYFHLRGFQHLLLGAKLVSPTFSGRPMRPRPGNITRAHWSDSSCSMWPPSQLLQWFQDTQNKTFSMSWFQIFVILFLKYCNTVDLCLFRRHTHLQWFLITLVSYVYYCIYNLWPRNKG